MRQCVGALADNLLSVKMPLLLGKSLTAWPIFFEQHTRVSINFLFHTLRSRVL